MCCYYLTVLTPCQSGISKVETADAKKNKIIGTPKKRHELCQKKNMIFKQNSLSINSIKQTNVNRKIPSKYVYTKKRIYIYVYIYVYMIYVYLYIYY